MSKKAENMKARLDKFIDYYIAAKGKKPDVIRLPKKDKKIFDSEVSAFDTYNGVKIIFE